MNTIRNRTTMAVKLISALALLGSLPVTALADQASSPWTVKTGLLLVDSRDPFSIDKSSGGRVQAGGNAELGAMIAVEYRLNNRVGLEAGVGYAKSPDVDDDNLGNNNSLGEGPAFIPLLVGANFHIVETPKLDLYAGPRVAFVNFGDFHLDLDDQRTRFKVEEEFGWGAVVGATYQYGNTPWAFVAEATYLDVDMAITNQLSSEITDSRFDPFLFNLGVSYRF